ncbi:hypothetical protein DFH07DRAFT_956104 [Mycena maculata]|uniref:Uncharacterized protein n=1 Tax=Mycena maculata TaxID=230809 RepID=A0AAD7JFV3_9AGAR|nr:hypothetical protein DFH07DRAFT_956104 [Mycena maculata]
MRGIALASADATSNDDDLQFAASTPRPPCLPPRNPCCPYARSSTPPPSNAAAARPVVISRLSAPPARAHPQHHCGLPSMLPLCSSTPPLSPRLCSVSTQLIHTAHGVPLPPPSLTLLPRPSAAITRGPRRVQGRTRCQSCDCSSLTSLGTSPLHHSTPLRFPTPFPSRLTHSLPRATSLQYLTVQSPPSPTCH